MTATLTAAQINRLHLVRKDTANRITTRKLASGQVRITEYVKGGDKATVVMDTDGLYL